MARKYLAPALARLTLPIIAKRKMYQPVFLNGRQLSKGGRESTLRWEHIEPIIDSEKITSVTDLGCAEGYFVRKSAEKGCFAIGVEEDARMLLWGQTTMTLDNMPNFGFIKMKMTVDNLHNAPRADMVIFLSVLHHVMYGQGEPYAFEFLKKVKDLTKKVMIFEMGQSNEDHHRWTKLLPDMGSNPKQWIKDYLLRAGFSRVEELCQVQSFNAKTLRTVFAAYI